MVIEVKKRLHRNLAQLISFQFLEFGPYYLGALFCLFATHWIQSHLPFLTKELADLIEKGDAVIETSPFLWLALGTIVFRTLSRLLFFYPARVLQKELRVELLDRLEKRNPSRYRNYNDGQIFQILSLDMEQLRALIGFALLQVGNIVVAMIILVPKLNQFNPDLVMAMIPLALAFLFFTVIVSQNHTLYRKTQDLQGEVQNVIMESYAGKKTIKNFHAEESFIDWFRNYSWKELSNFYRAGIRVGISIPLMPLGIGFSLLWGAHIVKAQELGASSLILFSGFVFLFLEPMMFLSWIGVVFTRSYGAWRRIVELVNELDRPSLRELELEKNNPSFGVEDCRFSLEFWGQSLRLKYTPQTWTVIVGKTGCGKSHLLTQIADVLKGNEIPISFVNQTPYLYNDTIEKNIFLGRKIDLEERRQAAKLLKLLALDFLADSEETLLELEVGENGKHLSGGQAKRVALIRSLMSEAQILLWDDPFSSVDLILEKQIVSQLRKHDFMREKTVILTSHRVTTVRASDELILLDRERGIVEKGPVENLLSVGKEAYAYFENQMV